MLQDRCPDWLSVLSVSRWCIVAKRLDGSNVTWYRGRPRPRPHVLDGDPVGTQRPHSSPSPLFGPCLLWPNGRSSKQLLSSCFCLWWFLAVDYPSRGDLGFWKGSVRESGKWKSPIRVQRQIPGRRCGSVGQVPQKSVIFCKLYYSNKMWKKAKQYLLT